MGGKTRKLNTNSWSHASADRARNEKRELLCYNRGMSIIKSIRKPFPVLFLCVAVLYFATGVIFPGSGFVSKVYSQIQPSSASTTVIPPLIQGVVHNAVNTIKQVSKFGASFDLSENLSDIKDKASTGQEIADFIRQATNKITSVIELINNWFDEKIGLNFFAIIKVIGNVFIWVLEKLIQLVRLGLEALP